MSKMSITEQFTLLTFSENDYVELFEEVKNNYLSKYCSEPYTENDMRSAKKCATEIVRNARNSAGRLRLLLILIISLEIIVMMIISIPTMSSSSSSSGYKSSSCPWIYSDGSRCGRSVASGDTYCSVHQRDMDEAWDALLN